MNILFTSPNCAKCQLAKKTLDDAKAQYVISQDANEAARHDISSVPALLVGEKVYHLADIIRLAKGGAFNV